MKKFFALLLSVLMLVGVMPLSAFAANDYTINSTTSTDDYYNLISKKDWDIAPGITESEIVLNNDDGSYRQVLHVMEADLNNEYVKVINSYMGMKPQYGDYKIGPMSQQAAYAEANGYGNVVGAMNTTLSWYSGYAEDRVNEPLGFIMLDAEILFDPGNCGYTYGNVGFPSVLVINKDFDENGNPRPADIPKVEMPQIRSAADLDGWEDQVIPCSSGYILKDGVNQYTSPNHTDAAPRSVVGIKPDGTVVIMLNDGRQAPTSAGMSMYELAEVMLDLGCTFAVNCDGGGSSTFLSQRPGEELKINNSPSDGTERSTTTGILFISTAEGTGEFVRADISTDDQYYTPGSSVQFNAIGTDLIGTLVEIPEEAWWRVDSTYGTIDENGLFTSTGATGVVTAELVYNDEVVGSASINIVIPDDIAFPQDVITVPNGSSTNIRVVATYDGVHEVTTKLSDFSFELSDATIGTLDGFTFTATDDLSVTTGWVKVTLVHDTNKTDQAEFRFGKASEVIWDFENGTDDWDTTLWKASATLPYAYLAKSDVYGVNSENGKVHDGEGAMALVADFTYTNSPTWNSFYVNYYGEDIVIENAQTLGCWLYIPDEIPYIEFYLRYYADGATSPKTGVIVYGDVSEPLESGWRYVSFDISNFKKLEYKSGYQFIQVYYGGIQGVSSLVNEAELNSRVTYYIDDVTVDYSTAVADREAPIFDAPKFFDAVTGNAIEIQGQTIDARLNSFEVAVQDTVKDNATGIDAASAKVYVDGTPIDCKYSNGRITTSSVEMANGTHTITFEIADINGNVAKISRKINIAAESNDIPTVSVVPHDATLDRLLLGSVYYVDINATNVEKTDKVVTTLDLNNHSKWELDHMEVAEGFEATYVIDSTDPIDNIATITITRVGENDTVGEGTLVSIPVRVWEWSAEESPAHGGSYDFLPEERWAEPFACRTIMRVEIVGGTLTTTENEMVPFGGETIEVDTELWANTCDGVPHAEFNAGFKDIGWHVHTVIELEDKAATCTEAGYSGRTYCEVCDSVVEWGTTIPATGHNYVLVDGVYICENCGGENGVANGLIKDGEAYRYFINGVAQSGWIMVDTDWHYFHADTTAKAGKFTVDGIEYDFEETGKLVSGVWAKTLYGMRYFYGPGCYGTGWYEIDGNRYYFENTYRYEGYRMIFKAKIRRWYNFGDDGICREDEVINGFYWDADKGLGYVVDNVGVDGLHKIDGNYYYFNYYGYAVSGSTNVGSTYCDMPTGNYYFGEDYKAYTGLVEKNGVTYYYENGRAKMAGLVEIDGDIYFAGGAAGEITVGKSQFVWDGNGILPEATYEFGADGKILNGIVEKDGALYYYYNGKPAAAGLVEVDGAYYFAGGANGEVTVGKRIFVWDGNGYLPEAYYEFGADGKMLNGIVEKNGVLYYYDNGQPKMAGLVEIDGDYYFAGGANGEVTVNKVTYIWKDNGIALENPNCEFGADGKMLNGIVEKDGVLYYYVMGRPKMAGLINIDGDYYFAGGAKGEITVNKMTYVWKDNGIALDNANCEFGADGKMLNGIVEKNGTLYYYVMGRPRMAGLVEVDGALYFAGGAAGEVTVGKKTYVWKANGILPEATYEFGADGKMLNGIVEKDGKLYYYTNGQAKMAGLVEWEGAYYFVYGVNGEVTVGKTTYVFDGNGILPESNYEFGADGKMLNGFVTKADGIYYYQNGKPGKVGLNLIDGDYYFVDYSGKLFTNGTYFVWETNGYTIGMKYTFDANGKLILK